MSVPRSPVSRLPDLPTLVVLFIGWRLPALIMFRPGGYVRPFPPLGTLDVAAQVGWRDWLLLGPSPLEPLLLNVLSAPFTGEVSRQTAIGLFSLPFELLTLVLIYRLASAAHGREPAARRAALFWAGLWLPLWSWLTGLAGIGVALALLAVWLATTAPAGPTEGRRRLAAVAVGILALLWNLSALVVLAPAWGNRLLGRDRSFPPWRAIGLALTLVVAGANRLLDPLLLLLAVLAVAQPSRRSAAYAGLLSLLFVLRDPVAPFLLTTSSAILPALTVAYLIAAVGVAAEWASGGAAREALGWRLRLAGSLAGGAAVLIALGSVPVALAEFRALARADSPFAPLLDELEEAPAGGYLLVGTHALYEQLYPFAWRRHTVRVVSERNAEALLEMITGAPEGTPVWALGHPNLDTALVELRSRLLAEGYPAGGAWFGDFRLERAVMARPTATATPAAPFADAVTLERAAWQDRAAVGAWVPVELVWAVPPGALPTSIFVHLLDEEGNLVAQHDVTPSWPAGRLVTRHALRLPAGRTGRFQLVVGRYLPETGERVVTPQGEDRVGVGTVVVTAPLDKSGR